MESGGHRWQRVPPTERKGRVHTSTVTVVALPIPEEREWILPEKDIVIFTMKSSGPGGQHVNKTNSCVVIRHLPTGIEAKADSRSQLINRKTARALLESKVSAFYSEKQISEKSKIRHKLRGSGMRGDKIRTYRVQDDIVTDHRSETKFRLKDFSKFLKNSSQD